MDFIKFISKEHPDPDSLLMQDDFGKDGKFRIGYEGEQIVKLAERYAEHKRINHWTSVDEYLPKDEIRVLCLHEHSGNTFVCYRTKDCFTNDPKWYDGAMPTHWMEIPKL